MVGHRVEPRNGLVHGQQKRFDQLHQRLAAEAVVPRLFHAVMITCASFRRPIRMGKAGKIAIGCVLFLFLAGVALIAGLGGLAWWGKGKLDQFTKGEQKIAAAQRRRPTRFRSCIPRAASSPRTGC